MKPLTPAERDLLVEQVVTAHRERDVQGRVRSSPAFHDLDEAGRMQAFEATLAARTVEAALDPEGRSTTVLSILRVVRGG
jgi:hypothetical protein